MERGSKGWPPTANQVREMLSGQSPSAMVAVPGGAMPHQVSGSGGAAALTLPAISLRRATAKQFVQWNVTLNNVIGWYNLTHVVEEGQPPTRAAIHGLYPDLDPEEVEEKYSTPTRCGNIRRKTLASSTCVRHQSDSMASGTRSIWSTSWTSSLGVH